MREKEQCVEGNTLTTTVIVSESGSKEMDKTSLFLLWEVENGISFHVAAPSSFEQIIEESMRFAK